MGKKNMVMLSVMMMLSLVSDISATITIPANDITCQDGIMKLMPCQPFLRGSDPPQPSLECCLGASDVYHIANTTEIRRSLCGCFKVAAIQLGILPDRAKKIPELCHIPLGIPIDPTVDCTKIPV